MSYLLNVQDIAKSIGSQQLFSGINISINSGDRIGLIGPNGSGKSTLLKILCGLTEPDSGTLFSQKNIRPSYLAQTDVFIDEQSVENALKEALTDKTVTVDQQYARIHELLSRAEFNQPGIQVKNLSGGWRKRLAICRSLITWPDILFLDEPTNHLDIEGILWLEKMLQSRLPGSPQAFCVVSHDRRFLENSVNRIIELNPVYEGGALQIDGTYSDFLEKKEEMLSLQQERETRLANKVRREMEWLRRGPKARTSKARFRIDKAEQLQGDLTALKARNRSAGAIQVNFDNTGRKTKKLLDAKNLAKSYGDKQLFANIDILLSPGTRLGLLGRNGCGKSTLMQILAAAGKDGGSKPDKGSVKIAEGVQIVHFDQQREQVDGALSLRRALSPEGDHILYRGRSVHVVSWAKRFLFRPDQLDTPVYRLSGGEQARILIAGLMRRPADILLLDEPTNDLDIPSLDVLEESLQEFPGAIVLVSHDRFLLDRLCDAVLGFDGKGNASYFADYEQWLADLQKEEKQPNRDTASKKQKKKAKTAGRLSYMDQREYDQMEEKIMSAESALEKINEEMAKPETAGNAEELDRYWREQQQLESEIASLYSRWQELEEKKSGTV